MRARRSPHLCRPAAALLAAAGLLCAALPALPAPSSDSLTLAKQRADLALEELTVWNGPTTGPRAASGKLIAFLASDLRNGGVKGALHGVEEAAGTIGWKLQVFDTESSDQMRKQALLNIAVSHFDGVIFAGFDALPYAPWIDNVTAAGTVVIGWHAAYEPGIVPGTQLFTNVASSAREVALAAASYAVVKSSGTGGFVIFTDSRLSAAQAKTDDMATIVKNCAACQLLAVEDVRLDEVDEEMPKRLEKLDREFGDRWTVNLGINDLYFDAMATLPEARADFVNISAGDGSTSAFLRVGTGLGQTATVAEPLNLQGWQLIDELNRAFNDERPSGYIPRPRLFTSSNLVGAVGEQFFFDPPNNYRQAYRQIWGK